MSLYFVDLIAIPLVTLLVAWLTPWSWGAVAWMLFGLMAFTFVEYWVHRVVLHGMFWSVFHQRHHRLPAEYVVFPLWYLPVMLAVPALVLPWPMLVGWYVGMIWFYAWHHVLHHWNLRDGGGVIRNSLLAYSNWHELHHKDLPVNYGITHPGWDIVFGTYCSTAEGHRRLMNKMLGRLPRIKPEYESYSAPNSPSGVGWRPTKSAPVTVTSNIKPHTCGNRRGGRRCDVCFARLP